MGKIRYKNLYPVIIVSFTLFLFFIHIACDYYFQRSQALQDTNLKLSQFKKSLRLGLSQFQSYLELTNARIIAAKGDKAKIQAAITFNPMNFTKSIFPKILSVEFIPKDKKYFISRYGKKTLESPISLKEDSLWSQDQERFTYQMKVMHAQSLIGILKVHFTVEPFLKEVEFPVAILKESATTGAFSIPPFPFFFIPWPSILTISQFFQKFWIKYVYEFLLLVVIIGGTIFIYRFKHYRYFKTLKISNESYLKNLKETQAQVLNLDKELSFEKKLMKLQKESIEAKNKLNLRFQQRQLEMLAQSQSILKVLDRFLEAESKESPLLKEAYNLLREGQLPLQHLQKGFLFQGEQDFLRINEIWEEMMSMFGFEIKKKRLRVTVHNELKNPPLGDNIIFELCLYNLFYLSIGRLRENGNLDIYFSESNGVKISFFDDGYDFDLSDSNLKIVSKKEIIEFSKEDIRKLVQPIGWQILFSKNESSNISELVIQNKSIKKEAPGNVVPLFGNQ